VRGLRLVVVTAGLGAAALCPPGLARVVPEPTGSTAVPERVSPALPMLADAARVGTARAWGGTQEIVSAAPGMTRTHTVHVEHVPGMGSAWQDETGTAISADVLDPSLLTVLAYNYDVRFGGTGTCAGRAARVVEVVRPGTVGAGAVAARMWLDAATHLLLRRDVFDLDGSVLRRVEMLDVHIAGTAAPAASATERPGEVLRPRGRQLSRPALDLLVEQGWPVPAELPRGFALYDARWHGDGVLQLAYSDGLSTTSVFVQQGGLPASAAGVIRTVQGAQVWQADGVPTRMAWQAGKHAFTLVSDANTDAQEAAVGALPHEGVAAMQDGVGSRVWRGLERVGAWLNPFD
jgi:sigma-E factor negative regulatory protein RseB